MKASAVKQGNGSLEETYSLLHELWTSIDQKYISPMKYDEDIEIHNKYVQDERLYQLLMAIDKQYDTVKREILKMEPLPSVDHAFGLIRSEEDRLRVIQPENSSGVATIGGIGAGLVARGRQNQSDTFSSGSRGGNWGGGTWDRRNNEEDKSKLVCSNCKRKGHTQDSCFELIGYPDWWVEKHGKPPAGPPARTPWNRGGHAAIAVDGGNKIATTEGNREAAQARGEDKKTKPTTLTAARATHFAG